MHRAPAVNFPFIRSRWHGRCIAFLSLLSLASTGAFIRAQPVIDTRSAALVLLVLLTSTVACIRWRKSPSGCLHWDGQQWSWSQREDAPQACRLSMLMDFQRVVLVLLRTDARHPVWLWLEATPGDTNWQTLRRAMVSSQSPSSEDSPADAPVQGEGAE